MTGDRSAAADTLRDEVRDVLAEEEAIAELAGLMVGVVGREDCARLVFAWHKTKLRQYAAAQVAAERERIAEQLSETVQAVLYGDDRDPGERYEVLLEYAARIARGKP